MQSDYETNLRLIARAVADGVNDGIQIMENVVHLLAYSWRCSP